MDESIVVPLGLFLTIGVSLYSYFAFKYRNRHDVQQTIRKALESGQQLSPDVLRNLTSTPDPETRDLRRGSIALGIGLALVLASFFPPDPDAAEVFRMFATFPIVLGLVYLALWKLMPRQSVATRLDG